MNIKCLSGPFYTTTSMWLEFLNARFSTEKMDVITETSLEALLQRATDYRNKNTDTAAIDAFCGIIKKEPEGPLIASRLIASKIQSPQEWEALQGLAVLETCMKSCGTPFHSEIGKFRFLNEMIKLVSPKFLGSRTPSSVRNQVLKMMYNWTVNYPKEHKIKEAYDMLIKQGVVQKDDAVCAEEDPKLSGPQVPSKANPLFQDEEKVRLLQKLLHSKNPEDLQAANRLIKTMVREDERRVEIKSKRIGEVETVRNNVRLLSEMLDSYRSNQSSVEELELIKDLYQGCERLKTNVFKLASETQDNDDLLSQVLAVSDELDQVLDKYKNVIILGRPPNKLSDSSKQVSSLLDLSSPVEELVPLSKDNSDILTQAFPHSVGAMDSLFSTSVSPKPAEKNDMSLNPLDAIFASLGSQNGTNGNTLFQPLEAQPEVAKQKPAEKNSKLKALHELDVLGETLLQECKINAISKAAASSKDAQVQQNLPLQPDPGKGHDTTAKSTNSEDDILMDISDDKTPTERTDPDTPKPQTGDPPVKEVKPLTDISVTLESIKPSPVPPLNVIEEKNGISVKIHMAKDTPREDVTVFVVTTLNKNTSPVTNYLFQAVVPKGCKMKLQPPSGSELPAHNPFLPPSAITQIMLIANPNKLKVTLKCMISCTLEDETITEMGEVDTLPSAT